MNRKAVLFLLGLGAGALIGILFAPDKDFARQSRDRYERSRASEQPIWTRSHPLAAGLAGDDPTAD